MSSTHATATAEVGKALEQILAAFAAQSGTIHFLGSDNVLHLAVSYGIPEVVLEKVRMVPVGKGMAGLAVERRVPVNTCNLQTDTTGDVRPGARASGLRGAVAVPIFNKANQVVGALGIGVAEERNFSDDELRQLMESARAVAPYAAIVNQAA